MSLENEYFHWKQMREKAERNIAKMEDLDVENMSQEQLEARERVIKGAKEEIKECEEMLEEIKEELVEFINNGGEVSEKTKEELSEEDDSSTDFESFDVHFKVISNRNEEIYVEGYVTINDEEAEDADWYFWQGSQYGNQRKIHHDGIEITGATVEQENEIAQFESDLADDGIWIDDCILQSDDDENKTHARENLTLIINEGD